ncbi:type VI secretion system membrane subunit TssM [Aromatoleum toluvorans]|uniref:Type VI secretion system membrane subunit TssM n=1 Tax=Aromatoleum toluvorans TaxID=92002 RepID=A0ABX1PZU1_9RHOO|nr:type VI secretion system membrane subunit TssM [Aromatoleum toluvorans]NMG44893.1 type VI secretion system membrane subunit TssM [Aromatoleum toluvorans]
MSALRTFLTDSRTLSFLGILALSAFLMLGARTLELALSWAAIASFALLVIWIAIWAWRRHLTGRAAAALERLLDPRTAAGESCAQAEIETLHKRMKDAIRTIKTSKLGQLSGRTALYELPWYITIGNPAAGKSTAVVNSGLTFPFGDTGGSVVQGLGGTRNCDWFFTTEGILLDTAGRYSVEEEDRGEWLGFLDLLRKNRPLAPINGIIVTASIGELLGNPPAHAIALAKHLRQRVQELTERLEVFAPVYVMFSKADLIAGFSDFFQDLDWNERDRIWGATLPYETAGGNDAITLFERHFDELHEGLRELSVAQMSVARGERMAPGLLAFPLEFAAIKPVLRSFIATLFEDNPFQFKPIFRGFYITSAIQSGETPSSSSARVETRFGLSGEGSATTRIASNNGFFLKDLFSKVIFADRHLVRHYVSRRKRQLQHAVSLTAAALLGLSLAGWSWSYANNRSLVENVRADLDKLVRIQEGRIDLQSRLESLEALQERIAQLQHFESSPSPSYSLGLGLFQGDDVKARLLDEYYRGVAAVLLAPVSESLEGFLTAVNRPPGQLTPTTNTPSDSPGTSVAGAHPYKEASPTNAQDAYNALKTYLMLSNREHTEIGHLSDQLSRFWRNWLEANRGPMPRERMMRSAERILSFHLRQANDPAWPTIAGKLALIDETRETLRHVVRGTPAIERVYADIKARASTRFPPVTVAHLLTQGDSNLVAGSHVISGAFTAEAWRDYVEAAIKEAATGELQSTDWVLDTSAKDDLSLVGSPEQIQKTLVALYKKEYANEWRRFALGISVSGFDDFPAAVAAMNRLGDTSSSPLGRLLRTLHEQTAWDNPMMNPAIAERAQRGFIEWFKHSILRMSPAPVALDVNLSAARTDGPTGTIGREFAGVGRLLARRDGGDPILDLYLRQLSGLRTRLNLLANQGDPGPGSIRLMAETIEGGKSELADTLRFVDEQMLTGMPDDQRDMLRPLLVRPLLQTFAALLPPAERELNKIWVANVHEPFGRKLARKYPFDGTSSLEATPGEIGQFFGPDGAISRFASTSIGALIVRRGDYIEPRTWGDLGIRLRPEFVSAFPGWVAPLDGGGAVQGAAPAQTSFRLLPLPAPGTTEYTIEIDGQKLRYRNGTAQWATFVWPNPAGTPGAHIVATTFDGQELEVASFSGRFGLEKLINSAARTRNADGSFDLAWQAGGISIPVTLKIVSSPDIQTGKDPGPKGSRNTPLPSSVAGETSVEEQAKSGTGNPTAVAATNSERGAQP